jgi:hypothetical protein
MKVTGQMIKDMEEASNDSLMETHIKGSSCREKQMEKVFLRGLMGKSMMENGLMVSRRVMVSGEVQKETPT